MDSVIITTNDWSVQDILPNEYPYLLKNSKYEEVKLMIEKVKSTYQSSEWNLAKEILESVYHSTSLDLIIEKYKEINESF